MVKPKRFSQPDRDWMELAECKGMDSDIFFPGAGGSSRRALKVCERCPVTEECLEYSVVNAITFGVWGGMNENGRRKLIDERRRHESSSAPLGGP